MDKSAIKMTTTVAAVISVCAVIGICFYAIGVTDGLSSGRAEERGKIIEESINEMAKHISEKE